MPRLVLGSASPRRATLLRRLGVDFDVCASDLTETVLAGEPAEAFVRRAAREKGAAVARAGGAAWVLSADTIVVIDDAVLGKPADPADARRMLQHLSGRTHAVLTAVALTAAGGELADELLVRTLVEFRALTEVEIGAYIAGGEPFDKAGAYAIQGGAAGFVARVEGSYTNVVGLPLDEVRDLLARYGLLSAARDRPVDRSS
jgi:nucleoside triphosphate pyrophosphatase